jgi:hypothetical protein
MGRPRGPTSRRILALLGQGDFEIPENRERDRCIFSVRSLLFFMGIPTSDARQMGFSCPPPTPRSALKKRKSLYFSL